MLRGSKAKVACTAPWVGLWMVVAGLLAADTALAQADRGDHLRIEGQVVDANGQPVDGVQVLFELSRERFSIRRFDTVEGDALRLPATTDANGWFRFDWRWDGHYNRFALAVGMDVRHGDRPGFERVHETDITALVEATPANASAQTQLVVPQAGYLRWLQRYAAGQASADEAKIFRERGRPDRIEPSPHFPGEVSWWYFGSGTCYRFVDGSFERVVHFDPIPDPPAPADG